MKEVCVAVFFVFVFVLDYFPCINGRRVPDSVKCNSVNDCGDDSDEQDCRTYIDYFVPSIRT